MPEPQKVFHVINTNNIMKKIKTLAELFDSFAKRNNEVKSLTKVPISDETYLLFISKYKSSEIVPDIVLLDFESSLRDNKYMSDNYSEISKSFWKIGDSGQGDEWFISVQTERIFFYDHNQGEYEKVSQFDNFKITFYEFLQMAFLIREIEFLLLKRNPTDKDIQEFISQMNSISTDLYYKYPYKYF